MQTNNTNNNNNDNKNTESKNKTISDSTKEATKNEKQNKDKKERYSARGRNKKDSSIASNVGNKIKDAASNTKVGKKVNNAINKANNIKNKVNDTKNKIESLSPANMQKRAMESLKNRLIPSQKDKKEEESTEELEGETKESGNSFSSLLNKGKKSLDSVKGTITSKVSAKVMLKFALPIAIPVIAVLTLVFIVSAAGSTSDYDLLLGANSVTGGDTGGEEFVTNDEDLKAFLDDLTKVKEKYDEAGKSISVNHIVATYYVINSRNPDFYIDEMDEDMIDKIAAAQFSEDGNSFDSETFKKNIKPILEDEIGETLTDDEVEMMFEMMTEYIADYKDLISNKRVGSLCLSSGSLQAKDLAGLSADEYFAIMGPIAQADYSRTGIFASVTLAQSIFESGWAKSQLSQQYNNMFGIKCGSWDPANCSSWNTQEDDGTGNLYSIVDSFRNYDSVEASVADHSDLLTSAERYAAALTASTPQEQIKAIIDGGYATDTTYVGKIVNAIELYDLEKWDVMVNTTNDLCYMGATEWTIRSIEPTSSDPAYLVKSSNRGQCVWYAQARAFEVLTELKDNGKYTEEQYNTIQNKLFNIYGDGGFWVEAAQGTFETSTNIQDIRAGALISWKEPGAYGHLAFIEEVTETSVTITEGWATNGNSCPNDFNCVNFNTKTVSIDEYFSSYGPYYSGGYVFSGYIYPLEG